MSETILILVFSGVGLGFVGMGKYIMTLQVRNNELQDQLNAVHESRSTFMEDMIIGGLYEEDDD